MGVTAAFAAVAVSGYSAYDQHQTANRALNQGKSVAGRQAYYNDLLMRLFDHPESVLDDPGYQLAFDQGTQAVERSSAARGFTGSGNAAVALQHYGQSFSNTYLNDQKRILAGLSGANVGNSPAQAYGVAGQGYSDSFNQYGQVLASLGYAFAGMDGSSGNPMSSGSGGELDSGMMDAGQGYIYNIPGG